MADLERKGLIQSNCGSKTTGSSSHNIQEQKKDYGPKTTSQEEERVPDRGKICGTDKVGDSDVNSGSMLLKYSMLVS